MENEKKDFLTIREFAKEISVHHNTIRKMIKNGRINGIRLSAGPGSGYRIARSEINRLGLIDMQKIVDKMVEEKLKEMR